LSFDEALRAAELALAKVRARDPLYRAGQGSAKEIVERLLTEDRALIAKIKSRTRPQRQPLKMKSSLVLFERAEQKRERTRLRVKKHRRNKLRTPVAKPALQTTN